MVATDEKTDSTAATYQPTSGNFDKKYHLNAELVNKDNRESYAKTAIGYHHPDYIKRYKGTNTHFPFYLCQPDVDAFIARPTDIAICGFPKSGSSRLSAILGMMLNNCDSKFLTEGENLELKVRFFEFCTPANEKGPRSLDVLNAQSGPRLFFTHLGAGAAAPSLFKNKAKIVYHIRNPKDIMVTLYFHFISRVLSNYNADLMEMVNAFVEDRIVYGPYFDHLASYWKLRNDPNLFILSFEQLSENFRDTVKELGKFLGRDLTEEQVKSLDYHCSFEQMKANPKTNRYDKHVSGIYNHDISPFLRCGTPGGWREHLTAEMNDKVNAWMAQNLAREDLAGLADRFKSTFAYH